MKIILIFELFQTTSRATDTDTVAFSSGQRDGGKLVEQAWKKSQQREKNIGTKLYHLLIIYLNKKYMIKSLQNLVIN